MSITFDELVAAEHEAGADSATPCDEDSPHNPGTLPECLWRALMVAPLLGIEVPPLDTGHVAIEAADGAVVPQAV